mmetsp:Transcript_70545/g.131983  ORF Transcript_70545/g.131983 Transcript_70545/m.131983 type:complete len:167 (+) Transcript_70545:72-572(+)
MESGGRHHMHSPTETESEATESDDDACYQGGADIPKILITSLASKRSWFSQRLAAACDFGRSTTEGGHGFVGSCGTAFESMEDVESELPTQRRSVLHSLPSAAAADTQSCFKKDAVDVADVDASHSLTVVAGSRPSARGPDSLVVHPPEEPQKCSSFRSSGRRLTK